MNQMKFNWPDLPALPPLPALPTVPVLPPPNAARCLVESHLGLVHTIAVAVHRTMPRYVDFDDLEQAGRLGLIDAARLYDPARGVPFRVYADRRIRGEMFDCLRDDDWVPRSERKRAEVDGRQVRTMVPLSRTTTDSDRSFADVLPDTRSSVAPQHAERRRLIEALTSGMSRTERLLCTLYWFEGLNQKETGKAAGICESRVYQKITEDIIPRIRARFSESDLREILGLPAKSDRRAA